ncbi:MAG: signal peptide peptidase SppA, partial [Myxococcales bacterium]|nr:signal peptide peptidase SppA [Myxococcales bacterium]
GWLDLVGVASQVLFFKSALDKLGLEADFVRMGKYKSAIEPLTQDTMSEPSRQAISELLEDFDTDLVSRVAKGRKLSEEKVRALIDEGPFDADRALELGLIDAVAFDDAAKQKFRDATKTKVIRKVPLRPEDEKVTLGRILEALTGGGKPQEPSGAHLAVVNVVGEIVDSEDTVPNQAASGPFVRHVRKLAYDDDVKAIVVRIDSPGGSALASDRMWHALHYAGKRKPIVVSIGDMAASGGYYIASAGKEVFAEPTSIVGSIGVFGGKISAANLADKVGVHVETIRRGKNAAWSSAASNFSDSERAVIQRMLERTYDRFVSRVSLSRGISREQVLSVAEGRVLTATRGERAGLVTKLGGFQAALDAARKLGGLDDDAPLAPWPSELGLLDALAGGDRDEAMLRAVLGERGAE